MKRKSMMACSTIIVLCLLFVTACETDIGEIENQNFATAIGVMILHKNGFCGRM